MKSILFATDFLESSRLALDYAVAFAHHYGAMLTIVHAFELRSEAREIEMVTHRPSLSREHGSKPLLPGSSVSASTLKSTFVPANRAPLFLLRFGTTAPICSCSARMASIGACSTCLSVRTRKRSCCPLPVRHSQSAAM